MTAPGTILGAAPVPSLAEHEDGGEWVAAPVVREGVLDALLSEVEHGALIQPFANCALYSPPKARPSMIDRLRELATSLYPAKPQLVVKHALPTAFRLLEDNRADMRTGTVQLLRTLHVLLGSQLFEHAQRAPAAVQTRLAEVIQAV